MKTENERVRLAKEVIARLDAGTILPSEGAYFRNREATPTGACRVCAAAALTVACCGFDKLVEDSGGASHYAEPVIRACLDGIFPLGELGLIEAAYEGTVDAPLVTDSIDEDQITTEAALDAALLFHDEDEEPLLPATERMRQIMQNIVKNDGEFRP